MAFFSSPVLAHGALGAYDEIIFLAVAIAFVAIMALSWWKNRDAAVTDDLNHADPTTPITTSAVSTPATADAPDRFPL